MKGRPRAGAVSRLALAALLAGAASAGAQSARTHYMLECQGCHLADGSGAPGSVPPLKDLVGSFLRVPGGREYLIRVPGSAQSSLADRELAEVLNWMIGEFGPAEVAADFVPFAAEEVARARAQPLADVDTLRRELLARIAAAPGRARGR
jgi:hypothetical protein